MMIKEYIEKLLHAFKEARIDTLSESFHERIEYTSDNCPEFRELYSGEINIEKIAFLFDHPNPDKKVELLLERLEDAIKEKDSREAIEETIKALQKIPENTEGKKQLQSVLNQFREAIKQKIALQRLCSSLEELSKIPGYMETLIAYNCNGPIHDLKTSDPSKIQLIKNISALPDPSKITDKIRFYSKFKRLCLRVLKTTDFWLKEWFMNEHNISLYHNFRDFDHDLKTITEFRQLFSLLNNELKKPLDILREPEIFSE